MPDTKISAAADIVSVTATDMLPVARSGSATAYHATMAEIATWANTNLPVASTTVLGGVKVDGSTITIASGVISGAAAVSPASSVPAMDGIGAAGTGVAYSRGDHVHPSDTTRAPLASPALTGSPTAPTVTPATDSSTKLATTAFVQSAMSAAGAGVSSWNTRTGAVTLNNADVVAVLAPSSTTPSMDGTAAVGTGTTWARGDHVHPTDTSRAPIASPTFTGAVTIPAGAAITGYAPLASPAFTGTPSLPTGTTGVTQTAGTSTTALATTQFTQAAVAPAFNNTGRNRIHNCGFSINQRSYTSGTALAAGAYGHDRWKAGSGGCTYTFTQTQPFTTISVTAGSLQQIVEDINVEGGTYTLSWTGTAHGRINAGSYATSPVTVSGLSAGTSITVEFNTGTLGAVQLEVGNIATPLAKRDVADEAALCQRFYCQVAATIGGWVETGTSFWNTLQWAVAMRVVPTVTVNQTAGSTGITVGVNATYGSGVALQLSNAGAAAVGWAAVSLLVSADL